MKERVAVLVSGGVDSAVALHSLARDDRYDLVAYYLKIWLEDDLAFLGECPWEEDLAMVRRICDQVGVPLEIISLQQEYRRRIVDYVLRELQAGRTPSSDILCNSLIKFGAFFERVGEKVDRVASGHYARLHESGGVTHLLRGVDPVKDQTYFLCRLSQAQVARCLFPIGAMPKAEVRSLALEWNLANARRPDSQGICFLGQIPYDEFVRHHLGDRPGAIVEHGTGRELGSHRGVWFHTIGQRRGLGLSGGPWYVVEKNVASNTVTVVHREALVDHQRNTFVVEDVTWIVSAPTKKHLSVRLRHGARLWPAAVELTSPTSLSVRLDAGDPGIAGGQFAVLYDDEECLGGGPIG